MKQPKLLDYLLLVLLALIWASAFFNIKIATYSFGPITIAFLRVFFGSIPVLLLCYYKEIKIEAFSKDWYWFAIIGFINLVAPFFLIAYGIKSVQSNLAAILMSTTPLSSTVLAHFYTKNEKFNFIKTFGILIGFSGILYLFSDNLLIDENNFLSALLILLGSTCYVIGGVLTLKISKKKNENVTGSILIWAVIILIPFVVLIEQPWNIVPRIDSIISVIYLFSDNLLINENNLVSALLILVGSTCYVVGGVLTLKISKKKNENVTGSILIWATIILIPLVSFIEQPWSTVPRLDSTVSVIYLGLVSTGLAWLLRFRILVKNGLIFQSQVSYLIPIFGTILSYIFLKELITIKVLISLIAVSVGIYFVRKADNKKNINNSYN